MIIDFLHNFYMIWRSIFPSIRYYPPTPQIEIVLHAIPLEQLQIWMYGNTVTLKNLIGDFYRVYCESPLLIWGFMILLGIVGGAYAGSFAAELLGL